MQDSIFVKPIDGVVVPDPETNLPLPIEGATVPRNTYWLRRIADGSVAQEQTKTTKAK